jgi:SAM-dependent methyltransferase
MRPHAEDLSRYYAGEAGIRVAARVQQVLAPLLAGRTQDRVLGLGYCGPYLQTIAGKVERIILAHPALQGYEAWPPGKPNCVAQVDDKSLPFADALFDQVVAIHALEFSDPVRKTLREIWRVLAPQGRLLLVVPNRTSLTALLDTSPFGNGRPFSAGQLDRLLRESLFEPLVHRQVLVLPALRGGAGMDRMLLRVMPRLGGLHIVLAQKTDSFAATGVGRVAAPVPVTAPA